MSEPTTEEMAAGYGLPAEVFNRVVTIRRESMLDGPEIPWNQCIDQAIAEWRRGYETVVVEEPT